MSPVAPHPYRTALESQDGEALAAILHPDVSFRTPGFEAPVEGRDKVLMLFGFLATVFEDPEITDELSGDGTRAIAFRCTVDGHPIEGVDHKSLAEAIRKTGHGAVVTVGSEREIAPALKSFAASGDIVICLGAGNSTEWAQALPDWLAGEPKRAGGAA